MEENKIRHLEMIQSVISRGANSFSLKRRGVPLIAGINSAYLFSKIS